MNPRQELFVENLFRTTPMYNATEAAKLSGYSPRTAASQASRLLKKVNIQEAIRARRKLLLEEVREDTIRTVQKLLQCIHYDVRELFDENGNLRDVSELPDGIVSAVQSVEVVKKRRVGEWDDDDQPIYDDLFKVKLTDKLKGIELLGRFQDLWKDTLNIPGLDNLGATRLPAKNPEGAPVPDFDEERK